MRFGHVSGISRESAEIMTADVAGHATIAIEDLDRAGGYTHVAALTHQLVGHAVPMPVDLDVIVDAGGRDLPDRVLIRAAGKRLSGCYNPQL
jgi:pyrimidine operon attenuation protein/uracil phosphoribosyltransferase